MKTDFPEAPIWFEEGITSLYEGFSFGKAGELHGVKKWHRSGLVTALNQPKRQQPVRVDALFGMSYALARYFCLWLEQRGQLWDFYHAWRDGYGTDATGEKAFLSVVGARPSEVNATWARWVRRI